MLTPFEHNATSKTDPRFFSVPDFRLFPEDIVISSGSAAAFACSISTPPAASQAVSISWLFNETDDEDLSPLDRPNIFILNSTSDPPLADSSTSILIIESVSELDEGFYACEVNLGEFSIRSETAELMFDGKRRDRMKERDDQMRCFSCSLANSTSTVAVAVLPSDPIIVDLNVSRGENLTLPCMASDLSPPFIFINPIPEFLVINNIFFAGVNLIGLDKEGNINVICFIGDDLRAYDITVQGIVSYVVVKI